jgi:hypothetical protein
MKAELLDKLRELVRAEIREAIDDHAYGTGYGKREKESDRIFKDLEFMCHIRGRI